MPYNPDIYSINRDNTARFALGMSGSNLLYVIGVNPSTADDRQPDPTVRKIMRFAEKNGYDGFIIFNLYPQRTPDPRKLHKEPDHILIRKNLHNILQFLHKEKEITFLAAWGNTISERNYLADCVQEIVNVTKPYKIKWMKIGSLTKKGHPRHPSRVSYQEPLTSFDMDEYIRRLRKD